jgi:hypothetical protein
LTYILPNGKTSPQNPTRGEPGHKNLLIEQQQIASEATMTFLSSVFGKKRFATHSSYLHSSGSTH